MGYTGGIYLALVTDKYAWDGGNGLWLAGWDLPSYHCLCISLDLVFCWLGREDLLRIWIITYNAFQHGSRG